MKIVRDNEVYIQMNDVTYMNRFCESIPASIFLSVFGSGMVIVDDRNRYDFIKFDQPEQIEFIKSVDWIADYNEIKDLTLEELKEYGIKISDEMNSIAEKFNSMSNNQKRENQDF